MSSVEELREKLGIRGSQTAQSEGLSGARLKEQAVEKRLFEIVQTVATELGIYNYTLPNGPSISYYGGLSRNELGNDRKYVFQRQGLKAVLEFDCKANDEMKYYAPASASVEIDGKRVFHEIKCLGRSIRSSGLYSTIRPIIIEPVVETYIPGDWESQLQRLYEQASHLKERREDRREAFRARMRGIRRRRSSFW